MSQITIGLEAKMAKVLLIPAAALLVAPTLWVFVVSCSDYRLGRQMTCER